MTECGVCQGKRGQKREADYGGLPKERGSNERSAIAAEGLTPPRLDAILYLHNRIANCTVGCSGGRHVPSELDEWGGTPREPVTVMPPLSRL